MTLAASLGLRRVAFMKLVLCEITITGLFIRACIVFLISSCIRLEVVTGTETTSQLSSSPSTKQSPIPSTGLPSS